MLTPTEQEESGKIQIQLDLYEFMVLSAGLTAMVRAIVLGGVVYQDYNRFYENLQILGEERLTGLWNKMSRLSEAAWPDHITVTSGRISADKPLLDSEDGQNG